VIPYKPKQLPHALKVLRQAFLRWIAVGFSSAILASCGLQNQTSGLRLLDTAKNRVTNDLQSNDLQSERGVDYTRLRDLLKEAYVVTVTNIETGSLTRERSEKILNDYHYPALDETQKVIAQSVGLESSCYESNRARKDPTWSALCPRDKLLNIPCTDLNTIERLWTSGNPERSRSVRERWIGPLPELTRAAIFHSLKTCKL
jgi:hypothetical protein